MGFLLTLLKGGVFLKLLIPAGSMLLSVAVYGSVYGWQYAVGLVALIFVHEMGHFIAARQRGLDVGLPTFIPFVGAWIQLKDMPHNVETEAYVGLAGPFVGTLGALACYFLGREMDNNSTLLAIAYAGFIINLFNLIPVSPLDGGRVTAVLSPRIWLAGLPILAAAFIYRPSPVLFLVGLLALPQLKRAWNYNPATPENQIYYAITAQDRFLYSLYYLALVGFLSLISYDLHQSLQNH
jgi:Zn-dependent protease